jgi:hypothetical protein
MSYDDFEIVVKNNKVDKIYICQDGKKIEIDEDLYWLKELEELRAIVNTINYYLRIHPLNNYIFNRFEYENYQSFMQQKKYNIKPDKCNPLLDRVKRYLRSI